MAYQPIPQLETHEVAAVAAVAAQMPSASSRVPAGPKQGDAPFSSYDRQPPGGPAGHSSQGCSAAVGSGFPGIGIDVVGYAVIFS